MSRWLPLATLFMLFGALCWSGCPANDDDDDSASGDDDASDDDAADDDAADDDAADDDAADDDVSDDDAGDDDVTDDSVTATVLVPPGFSDTPVSLYVGYLDGWEATETAGDGFDMDDPPIGDGVPLEIEGDQAGLAGEYIIVVVLYVEGGTPDGEGWPTEGVDYVWYTEETLGAGPIDLGNVTVQVYTGPPE